MDFTPMPRRPPGPMTRALAKVSDSVRSIEAQREPHAHFWDEWNAAAARQDGPLWIALGDSSSQGIGADDPAESWVPRMVDRLRRTTGEPWRAINLSMTGAQFSDIRDHQLPRMHQLESSGSPARLVTHLAGANDLLAPFTWTSTRRTLRQVLSQLPDRAVVGRVGTSSPLNGVMARLITRVIEHHGADRSFELFWPWAWPSRDGLAGDRWHPSAIGYGYMVDLIWAPITRSLGLDVSPERE